MVPPASAHGRSTSLAAVRIDLGLEVAVTSFVEALTPVMRRVVEQTADNDPAAARHDVVVEAYNLTCAFIDADGLATDDELWSLIRTFSPLLDTQLLRATPADVRLAGLTTGAATFVEQPSTMFEILRGLDRRDGTDHASTYARLAVDLAHVVASLDLHNSRTELLVIERFRGMLCDALTAPDTTATPTETAPGPTPTDARSAPEAATATDQAPELPRPDRSTSCWPSSTTSSGSTR